MADEQRRAGPITIQVNGEIYEAIGNWTYNLGKPKRTELLTADGKVIGYKEEPQTNFLEGEIYDRRSLDLNVLLTLKGATVTLGLANGKSVAWYGAWYAHEGTVGTEEAKIPVRIVGIRAEELPAA